jgi:hypothetical protein
MNTHTATSERRDDGGMGIRKRKKNSNEEWENRPERFNKLFHHVPNGTKTI